MAVRTRAKLALERPSELNFRQDGGKERDLCFKQDNVLKSKSVDCDHIFSEQYSEAGADGEETLSNSVSDNLEVESGVESASGGDVCDWLSFGQYGELDDSPVDLDLTTEQARETLRYFSKLNNSF